MEEAAILVLRDPFGGLSGSEGVADGLAQGADREGGGESGKRADERRSPPPSGEYLERSAGA